MDDERPSESDNVVEFSLKRREDARVGLRRKPTDHRYCRHRSVSVCGKDRIVECAACQAVLDPIAVLLQFADGERHFEFSRREQAAMEARAKELRDEEKKLKARIRSAKKSDISEAVAAALAADADNRKRSIANANEAIESMRKIVRALGGRTDDQRAWGSEVRRRKRGPTRIYGDGT